MTLQWSDDDDETVEKIGRMEITHEKICSRTINFMKFTKFLCEK